MTHTFTEYTPLEYLKIDIASNYGDYNETDLEKMDFQSRIEWFDNMERDGALVQLIDTADKPALFYAGLQAYKDCLDGKPTGYPISLDACSSGLQILSVLSNCEKSAIRCGVVSTGHREDAYTSLFGDMKTRADFELKATRSNLKQAIMTALYGSKAQPRKLFGNGSTALHLFYRVMEEEIPGAWALNEALKGLWQSYAESHDWIVPDGFEVSMNVEERSKNEVMFMGETVEVYTMETKGTARGLSLSPNIVHSIDGMIVREIVRRCRFDPKQVALVLNACEVALKRRERKKSTSGRGRQRDILLKRIWDRYLASGFLSARVIDLIDENNINMVSAALVKELIHTLPVDPFDVITVHDCFRVHPNYGNDLRRQYNRILSDLAASNILGDIATQITGRRMRLEKVGNISAKILNADYALS